MILAGQINVNPAESSHLSKSEQEILSHDDNLSELLTRAQSGDESAISMIFDQYYFRVIGFVRNYIDSYDVEDITQEAFINVFKNLENIKKKESFEGYLFRTAKNKCINWLRKKKRVRDLSKIMVYAYSSWSSSEVTEPKQRITSLDKVVKKLPESLQKYVTLFYVEKHTRAEIADIMNESNATVYRRMVEARSELIKVSKSLNVEIVFKGRHGLSIQEPEA